LKLKDAYIVAAVRFAPPDNKPTPDEIAACHPHLVAEVAALPCVKVIVALGKIGFDAAWRLLAERGIVIKPKPIFAHGAILKTAGPTVVASFHPSRQNTNTRKLTPPMLEDVLRTAARLARA
jgi:uracil-DNA glycosylase